MTVAAFGDSLTQGYGLGPGDGFVPQLQDWLDARGVEAVVLNAGVSGDTSAGGLARVDWTLTPEVDAMIVEFGGNDFLRALAPEEVRENLEGILAAGEAAGVEMLVVGFEAGRNYGPEYKSAFDALFPELAEAYGAAFYPSWFDGLLDDGVAAARGRYFQADGIHPNAEGVHLIVEHIGPSVEALVARAAE